MNKVQIKDRYVIIRNNKDKLLPSIKLYDEEGHILWRWLAMEIASDIIGTLRGFKKEDNPWRVQDLSL